jgi:predicted amidohydrolase
MKNLIKARVLLVQAGLFWADAQANRDKLEAIVRENASGYDIVVFPETFTSGFLGDVTAKAEDMNGPTVAWMKALSAEMGCVLCGSAAIATDLGMTNRLLWVQPDGELQFYDKRHLFAFGGENERYVAGADRKVFNYRGWRVCAQICYDLRFPVWCRYQGDYDALLFVANWPEPRTAAWSALLRARAIENQCYVIGVNRSGSDPRGMVYAGASAIYGPLGEEVLNLGDKEVTQGSLIDLNEVKSVRRKLPFQQDADSFELI